MMAFVPPLKVHLGWFETGRGDAKCSEIARELYEFLHRPLSDDVVLRPGLEIPVEFGRSLAGLLDALEKGTEAPAGVRVVVAILDKAAFADPPARKIIDRARERWPDVRVDEVFVPIVLDKRWYGVLPTGAQEMLAAVAADDDPSHGKDRRWKLGAEVAVVAARALQRRLSEAEPPKPRVMISYGRRDGLELSDRLRSHFDRKTKLRAWFDEADISHGEELGRQLDAATGTGVVLVVRTDSYSESPWCARELLHAKQSGTPIVTLLATSDGEPVTSAYGGNHRTIHWQKGREWEVVARCAQAWLHGYHFPAHARAALSRAGLLGGSAVLARRPELLDLLNLDPQQRRPVMVHPDPPVTFEELELLKRARPSVRLATPSTLFGRVLLDVDLKPPLHDMKVGFSLADSEELPKLEDSRIGNGLTRQHLLDVVFDIVLATLSSGASIAYGGDFRKTDGYTKALADLHRSRRRTGTGSQSQLTCFLDAATGDRDGDGSEIEFNPVHVAAPDGAEEFPEARSILWHLAMRLEMSNTCQARVMIGGKVRPSRNRDDRSGYSGPWPGLLEEAWRTLEQGRALYVAGGFGGTAGLITQMLLEGRPPPEFSLGHAANAPLSQRTRDLDTVREKLLERKVDPKLLAAQGDGFTGMEQMAAAILSRWQGFVAGDHSGWDNGLSVEENQRLFRATDRTEITHLVFEGLRRVAASRPADTSVSLYHGDIASAANVDSYAVTVTPGVKLEGAAKALDDRTSGRISGFSWGEGQRVAIIQVDSPELAGSYVAVARLELPAPGSVVDPGVIWALVREVARALAAETDRRGSELPIAVVPFGATLGLPVAESVRAIYDGYVAGGGSPKKLLLCEADRARYELLRQAFPDAAEVRAGPSPVPSRMSLLLNVAMNKAPTSEDPVAELDATLIVPDSGAPVVPMYRARLPYNVWFKVRDRYVDFEETDRMGRLLWQTVLSPEMRSEIERLRDRPLIVVADVNASGLPWEILTGDEGGSPTLSGGLIRRIALGGAVAKLRPRTGIGSRLRVLLVYNPDGLRSVTPEKEAIEAALRGRADVHVDAVKSPTSEEIKNLIETGYYDVLHYAGHAEFNEQSPEKSGLRLADGQTFTAQHLAELNSPRFVFLSACESGRVRRGQSQKPVIAQERPLAEAFLRRGAEALLGTFFSVDDRASRAFATKVYTDLAAGIPLGDAVQAARLELHQAKDPDWANFLMFGDETLTV